MPGFSASLLCRLFLLVATAYAQLPLEGPNNPAHSSTEPVQEQGAASAQNAPTADSNLKVHLLDATPLLRRARVSVSSASAKVGDRVPFQVVDDVKADGLVVIQRGATAWGTVVAVQPKRRKTCACADGAVCLK